VIFGIQILAKSYKDFYEAGADDMRTVDDNLRAFARYRISRTTYLSPFHRYRLMPRMLVDVSKRTLTANILGKRVNSPIGIAPSAMHKLAHPDGEIAAAKAAESR